MSPRDPYVVRLTLPLLRRGELALARALGSPRAQLRVARRVLACRAHELRFARAVLSGATQLWLLRVDQRGAGGDFLMVDMSSPRPERRRVLVLELKLGARLRRRRTSTHQVRRAVAAVAAAARLTGVIPVEAPFEVWEGDPRAIAATLTGGGAWPLGSGPLQTLGPGRTTGGGHKWPKKRGCP